MLPHRATRSIRLLSHATASAAETSPSTTEAAHKPTSILSRLSDRTRIRRNYDTDSNVPLEVAHRKQGPQATSFISARSAKQRDHATEKWFTGIRKLDIDDAPQSDDLKSLTRKKRTASELPRQHEMRPKTNLNTLFAPSTARSATSLRLQTKRELGGDYTSYLPSGYADPHRFPVDYARLVLGRNKCIPLSAQTGALNVVEEAVRGRATRQGK